MASAVIVAAGRGKRMGSDKLFLEVGGLPVVGHAWKRFDAHPDIEEVVLVVRPDNRSAFEKLAVRLGLKRPYILADGGAERQDSVLNGLQAVRAGAGDGTVFLLMSSGRFGGLDLVGTIESALHNR